MNENNRANRHFFVVFTDIIYRPILFSNFNIHCTLHTIMQNMIREDSLLFKVLSECRVAIIFKLSHECRNIAFRSFARRLISYSSDGV